MRGTITGDIDRDSAWVRDSLFALGGVYRPYRKGEYVYFGTRPGPDWYGHGYFPKRLTMLVAGWAEQICIWKHRWIDTKTGATTHSRPPDDPELVRYCTLIVFLRVWGWVSSGAGFHNREEMFEGLETGCGSDRTVQRWTSRAMSNGMEIQQAIRLSIIEERERAPAGGEIV